MGTKMEAARGIDLVPLGDRIIVRVRKMDEMTAGGVILTESTREASQEGDVLAVGEGRWDPHSGTVLPLPIRVGEVVLFSKYGGTELPRLTDDGLLVLREADVLARRVQLEPEPEPINALEQAMIDTQRHVPEGMLPMPETGAETPYELITRAEAITRGLLEEGRVQESRRGFRYDYAATSYWPEEDPPDTGQQEARG